MRYVRIFLLFFENVFQYRGQIFVWFLISFFHPLIYLLFWRSSSQVFSSVTYYYLFFIVAGGLLYVHVDVDAYEDIQQGQLSLYLMKPLSYLLIKFLDELPWRLIQGSFGLLTLAVILFLTRLPVPRLDPGQFVTAVCITSLGYLIMFLFKMIILLLSLWVTDIGGLQQFSDMLVIIFAGFIMPIRFFPEWIARLALLTPLPYSIYYPVTAFQGLLGRGEVLQVVLAQCIWIGVFYVLYGVLWRRGLMKYTAVGQ